MIVQLKTVKGLGSYENLVIDKHRTLNQKTLQTLDWLIGLIQDDLPIVVTDQGRILFASESACIVMGYPLLWLQGKSVIDIIQNTSGIRAATKQIAHQKENHYIHEYQHPEWGLINLCAQPRMVRIRLGKNVKNIRITALSIVAG